MRSAVPSDFFGILSITEGEDLWDGCDYLPFALKDILEEEHLNGETSRIKSFVFLYQEEIIGFHVLGFQSENFAVKFSFRIKKELQGLGFD